MEDACVSSVIEGGVIPTQRWALLLLLGPSFLLCYLSFSLTMGMMGKTRLGY